MSESNGTRTAGVGVMSAFVLVFTVLKLTGHIDWSWWWVFSPWWAPVALGAALLGAGWLWIEGGDWWDDFRGKRRTR